MAQLASPIHWQIDADGVATPHATHFVDIYRSSGLDGQGGWQQARHVFLQGCGLLAGDVSAVPLWQKQKEWHIVETGLGLGLNFLAAYHACLQDKKRPAKLIFSSVEAWPVAPADIMRGCERFTDLQPLAAELAAQWQPQPGLNVLHFEGGAVELRAYIGDVIAMLPLVTQKADSIFLDGFNPKLNGAMWGDACMAKLARLARPGTQLATWTVASEVRVRLQAAGFACHKRPGLPPKRHCLHAIYQPAQP